MKLSITELEHGEIVTVSYYCYETLVNLFGYDYVIMESIIILTSKTSSNYLLLTRENKNNIIMLVYNSS